MQPFTRRLAGRVLVNAPTGAANLRWQSVDRAVAVARELAARLVPQRTFAVRIPPALTAS